MRFTFEIGIKKKSMVSILQRIKMKYNVDYETDSFKGIDVVLDERSGFPIFANDAFRANRCIKCNRIVFSNYKYLDYKCLICKDITI